MKQTTTTGGTAVGLSSALSYLITKNPSAATCPVRFQGGQGKPVRVEYDSINREVVVYTR